MLFQPEKKLESEKERNFYSKVFAGYYFNELVVGYEARLQSFSKLLRNKKDLTFACSIDERFQLSPKSTHVTFDFHSYLLDEQNDRGELADILIADIENESAVAIEVKFLSDWDFEDDIMAASRRFECLLADGRISFIHVLLVTQSKLDGARRAINRKGSNWAKLSSANLKYPVVVLTWEEIAETCEGPEGMLVKNFVHQHVEGSRESFRANARTLLGLK